jgi:hypothetical protein
VVEVEADETKWAAVAQRVRQLGIEPLLEPAPVEAPGQRIGPRNAGKRVAALLLIAGVPSAERGRDAEAEREERRVLGVRAIAGHSHGDVCDVIQGTDRHHRGQRIGERGEDHRHEEHQRQGAGGPAVRPRDGRDQRDLGSAPQQEERLAPFAAHNALVRDQDEQQRDDGADSEERGDQVAVRPVPGGGHIQPAGRA